MADVRAPHGGAVHPPAPATGNGAGDGDRIDVYLAGTVFLDLVFTGLEGSPSPGTECYATGLGASPGGVATVAVALARLGLRVRLAALFGDDMAGDYLWHTLAEVEAVDLRASRRVPGWSTPVTVSLAYHQDRSMVTHSATPPGGPPDGEHLPVAARGCFAYLGPRGRPWLGRARELGIPVFADVGWDGSGEWPATVLQGLAPADVFLPNAVEAMAYTRTTSARAALAGLSRRLTLAVVKCGPLGAIATEAGGPVLHEPALVVEAADPTGAGDVFDAAFIYASLAGWPLQRRLRFAVLCSGLSVRHHGGAMSAPTWADIAAFHERVLADGADGEVRRWAFLAECLPGGDAGGRPGPVPVRHRFAGAPRE